MGIAYRQFCPAALGAAPSARACAISLGQIVAPAGRESSRLVAALRIRLSTSIETMSLGIARFLALGAAPVRTEFHGFPVSFPFLPPRKRAMAQDARLCRQTGFLVDHCFVTRWVALRSARVTFAADCSQLPVCQTTGSIPNRYGHSPTKREGSGGRIRHRWGQRRGVSGRGTRHSHSPARHEAGRDRLAEGTPTPPTSRHSGVIAE